jgi:hypothetical protein
VTAKPENSDPKQGGRFEKGRSGNPAGKPRGARNKTTRAVEALLEGESETLARKAIELALGGDVVALRLCIDRIAPPRRDRPVIFSLPEIKTAADASRAMAAIVGAVASGALSPSEGEAVSCLVERFVRIVETTDFERRLAAVERQTAQ